MSLRKQATSGLVWTFAQQFGNQLIGFLVSLFLARLLLPEEFGLIGMIAVFIGIGNTLLNAGLTQSLVRSTNLDQEDYSTVFYFNFLASVLIYWVIFFIAPQIALFYEHEILTNLIRVYSITFIINSFSAVQLARLTRRMDFKTQTLVAIPATLIGGLIGITMAYKGYGVWSLVWSYIITSFLSSIQLWLYSKWKPSLIFNKRKFFKHFNFGYKLTLSTLLETVFQNIYLIVIGKQFSAAQVGFYTRAETTKQLPVTNISAALNKVTYPLFASIQNDDLRLKRIYQQIMQMVIFIIAPILIILAVIAEPVFRFLFTAKWLPAVPYFQILCITGILYPIHAYNLNILNVKGRSDLYLKLEVVKKIVVVITVVITIQYGIIALLYGQVFTSIIAFLINTHYTGKMINYNAWEQTKDVLPAILLSFVAGSITWVSDFYKFSDSPDLLRIILGCLIGSFVYLVLAYILKIRSLNDIIDIIKKQ